MYFIALFGFVMMCLSVWMIINPTAWTQFIVSVSNKSYFHWFEVLSRLFFGVIFVFYSEQSQYPKLFAGMGYLLVLVSIGLLIIGQQKHRQFALWSATRFRDIFRPAGIVSFSFGLFLIYSVIF